MARGNIDMAKKETPYWELPSFVQYSKKMCTRVTIFWMAYRVINFVVILLRPDIATALVDLCAGVDTAMICNMGFYVGKSGFENVAKILAANRSKKSDEKEETQEDEEVEESEG